MNKKINMYIANRLINSQNFMQFIIKINKLNNFQK